MANTIYLIGMLWCGVCAGGIGIDSSESKTSHQQVDLIELNHFIDEDGREVFRQTIFYDWSPTAKRFHVRAWRLVHHDSQLPVQRWRPAGHDCSWIEGDKIRRVTAKQLRETWTQEDPERVNRQYLPEELRKPLFGK